MIARWPPPSALAACTKSRALSDSTSPRTTRAIVVQPSATRTMNTLSRPGRSKTAMRPMASTSDGNAITTSVTRMSAASTAPPK